MEQARARSKLTEYNSAQLLEFIAELVESAYGIQYFKGQPLNYGLNAALPTIFASRGTKTVRIRDSQKILQALDWFWRIQRVEFLVDYALASDEVEITSRGTHYDVRFTKLSIPRQYSQNFNTHLLLVARELSTNLSDVNRIRELLRGEPEFGSGGSPRRDEAAKLIAEEATRKVTNEFMFFDSASTTDLGSFRTSEFIAIYRYIAFKALYHRYSRNANALPQGAVHFPQADFVQELAVQCGTTATAATEVLRVLTYDASAHAAGERADIKPLLFLLRDQEYVLMPHRVAGMDAHICLMRHVAQHRRNAWSRLTKEVSISLTKHIARCFEQAGYHTALETDLHENGQLLTDIDLLAAMPAPNGIVDVLVGEVKAVIPPMSARDHVTVLRDNSIKKAFGQLDKIERHLATSDGQQVLRAFLDRQDKTRGKTARLHFVVLTSFNAGMFFEAERHPVLEYRSLRLFLETGQSLDVIAKWWLGGERAAQIDHTYTLSEEHLDLGGVRVKYPEVTPKQGPKQGA